MKRSNFTFLMLFALLSFFALQVQAQPTSSACNGSKNITVDANCKFLVDAAVLGVTGPAASAGFIYYTKSNSGTAFPGEGMVGGAGMLSIGCQTYELRTAAARGGNLLCWGEICLEVKNIPPPVDYGDLTKMCGQSVTSAERLDISDAQIIAAAGCYPALSNWELKETTLDGKCYNDTIVRSVFATVTIKDVTSKHLIAYQTIYYMPLLLNSTADPVVCPIGTFANPATVWCSDNGDQPDISPAGLEAYFDDPLTHPTSSTAITRREGIRYAWPWIDKGANASSDAVGKVLANTDVVLRAAATCNIAVKWIDMRFAGCVDAQSKIMRTFTLLDWCTGTTQECVQWIQIKDNRLLVWNTGDNGTTLKNRTISIEPWICYATYKLPDPVRRKGCSGAVVRWEHTFNGQSVGTISSGNLTGLWLKDSPVLVTAIAENPCGQKDTTSFWLTIIDDVKPVVISDDKLNVTLTVGSDLVGIAKVYAKSIDEGSHDAGCGPVDLCVTRPEDWTKGVWDACGYWLGYEHVTCSDNYTWMPRGQVTKDGCVYYTGSGAMINPIKITYCAEYVKFCCADVGEQKVKLHAIDQSGNYGEGWTTVNVEDKSNAGWGPSNGEVDCHFADSFAPTKPSYGGVICNNFTVTEYSRVEDATCGKGYIIIKYQAKNAAGEVVSTSGNYWYPVTNASPFDPTTIKWPKHYNGEYYTGPVRECETDTDNWGKKFTYVRERFVDPFGYTYYIPMGDAFTCESGSDTGEPVWCNTRCSVIGKSYEDETVAAADACKKIIRRWTVVDWCTWVPNSSNGPDDSNDTSSDVFEAVDDEWLPSKAAYAWTPGKQHKNDSSIATQGCLTCEKPSGDAAHVYFRYALRTGETAETAAPYNSTSNSWTNNPSKYNVHLDGYYTFDQVIKIIDETDPTVDAPATHTVGITDGAKAKGGTFENCKGSETLTATATDVCGTSELDASTIVWWIEVYDTKAKKVLATKSSVGASATMSTQSGVPGNKYEIRWLAKDGCGNTSRAVTVVDFKDTKKPTPVCIQDISTATMNVSGGPVSIWAKDYDLGSFDNCSAVTVNFKDAAGKLVPSLSFTCADIPNGVTAVKELKLYVTDASGNEDYCYVTLRIDDNSNVCPDVDGGAAAISGVVATATGDKVESAKVSLNGTATSTTKVDGIYAFASNPMYSNYSVRAEKNDDFMNGVSTLDLVLIQKHVLGLQTLDSPYKVIAADINSDQKVSAIDLVELRKLILGVYTVLPNNKSWRFVDSKQTFAETTNPFPFTEDIAIANLSASFTNGNFVAAKIGDVSGNAIANSALAGGTRSAGTVSFEVADSKVKAGETVRVEVKSSNFNEVAAYQFTMNVKGLALTGVESGAINVDADNFGMLDANTITTAWFNASPVSSKEILFTLTFKANADVQLSKAIELSSRVTKAEAYGASNERMDVEMVFNKGTETVTSAAMELYQNEPNPFDNVTKIGFKLAQAGQATLTVFDVTGKTVSVVKGQYNRGYNEITLKKSELNATGVMYYQLESGEFTATKKMILID